MTKILYIEDEDSLREEVAEWLMLEGYDVITASDGVDGANAAVLQLPDLIICDIMMPRLDGYGVMLHIRANSLTQLTPFIFTTARVSHEDIRHGMGSGADDYVTKPFTRLELFQAIQVQLAKRAALKNEQALEVQSWQRALEQEREQRLLKAKLVAMFSHDFRNPLTTITSSVSLVRDYSDRLDEEGRRKHLNRAEASARQLLQMLDDLLFLAQMDASSLDLKPEPLIVGEVVEEIIDEFREIYSETHTVLFVCFFNELVMADSRLLRQIASNLLSNAIKYSPPGTEIRVMLDKDSEQYFLTVQDHGIGIPETDQPRMFTAFQRGSNVRDVSGTGLGLAIVQQAVDLLGGSIRLESQVGIGTTVTLSCPLHR